MKWYTGFGSIEIFACVVIGIGVVLMSEQNGAGWQWIEYHRKILQFLNISILGISIFGRLPSSQTVNNLQVVCTARG